MSQDTDIAGGDSRTNGRSSNDDRNWVKFMRFFRVFTFNKYSEFMASLVIRVHARVGLWRMYF